MFVKYEIPIDANGNVFQNQFVFENGIIFT